MCVSVEGGREGRESCFFFFSSKPPFSKFSSKPKKKSKNPLQYGNVMLDVAGMSKSGIERKATCRALFSKLLFLSEAEELFLDGQKGPALPRHPGGLRRDRRRRRETEDRQPARGRPGQARGPVPLFERGRGGVEAEGGGGGFFGDQPLDDRGGGGGGGGGW